MAVDSLIVWTPQRPTNQQMDRGSHMQTLDHIVTRHQASGGFVALLRSSSVSHRYAR